jgi:hypothetical protein
VLTAGYQAPRLLHQEVEEALRKLPGWTIQLGYLHEIPRIIESMVNYLWYEIIYGNNITIIWYGIYQLYIYWDYSWYTNIHINYEMNNI